MKPYSLQRELIARVLVAALTLAGVAGAGVFFSARHALVEQFDAVTVTKARAFASLVEIEPDGTLEIEASAASIPEYYRPSVDEFFELRRKDGTLFESSPALAGKPLLAHAGEIPHFGQSFDLKLPDGRDGRAVVVTFEPWLEPAPPGKARIVPPNLEKFTLAMARDRTPLDRMLNLLLTTLWLAGLALSAGIALAVVFVVRRTLEPVEAVAAQAARIDATTLDRRLPLTGLAAELRPICQCINELLSRVEASFKRERQFTANVAHELRTPIAELRTLAEVAMSRAKRSGAEPDLAYRDALDIARQMESTVTALLALARCTEGTQTTLRTVVDVSELVQAAWRRFASASEARGLVASCDVPPEILGVTDRALLAAMIENLLSNAVEYSPRGGLIRCRMDRGSGRITLSITNTAAAGLTTEDVSRMCEPFWRKDAARTSSTSSHAGLGLALVEAYAKLLGIEFTLNLDPSHLFTATISLSAAAPATLPVQANKPVAAHHDAPPTHSMQKPREHLSGFSEPGR